MKALVVFCLFSVTCYSQSLNYEYYTFTFEDTTHHGRLFIDTISNPDNSWQIGPPQKNVFSEAQLSTNAIVTDTINPYPINDTSVFTVIHKVNLALSDEQIMALSGYYKVDSDSLKDFGLIEYSPDNGITWLDMINDELFDWSSDKPVLTGSSDWSYFYVTNNRQKHRAMMKVKIYKLATQELNHPSLQPSLRGLTLASRSNGQIIY